MKEPNTIDNLFKDAFDGFAIAPDASVKSEIDARIFAKSGKRRAGFWLFFVGLGMGTAALFAGVYYSYSSNQEDSLIGTQRLAQTEMNTSTTLDKQSQKASTTNETVERDSKTTSAESLSQSFPFNQQSQAKESRIKTITNSAKQSRGNASATNGGTQFTHEPQSIKLETDKLEENRDEVVTIHLLAPRKLGTIENDLSADLSIDQTWKESLSSSQTAKETKTISHSITAFVNYGFESTNSNREQVDYNQLENAQIQLRTAALKVEYKKSFTSGFAWNVGLGYADHSVLQKGRMTTWDSMIAPSSISTLSPETIYVPSYFSGTTRYRFQQFQLGLGMTFNYSLFPNWNLDVSLGSDFSLGKLKQLDANTFYESPEFSSFGLSLYLRPAIEYRLRKYSLLVFGQVNQSLVSHLQWSFIDRRNLGFGGGIACRYYF